MRVYYLLVLYVLVVGGLAHYNNARMNSMTMANTGETTLIKKHNSYGIWQPLLFFGLFFVQGFRYYVGADFFYYFNLDVDWNFVVEQFKTLEEPMIYLLSFIARSIWDHPQANIVVFAFFITFFLYYGAKQYDDNNLMMIVLMYVIYSGFNFAINGTRQALALTFIFAFSKKAKKHWILKYVIVVLIAFLFHRSALMFLPMLIISQLKIDKYQIALLTGCAFVIPLFYTAGYEFMKVTVYDSGYMSEQINPIRILVAFTPLLLLLFIDRKEFFKEHYFETNMTIFNAIITLTTSSSAYLNRFAKYSSIFLIIFIPNCLKQFPKKVRIILTILTSLLFFLYTVSDMTGPQGIKNWYWIFPYVSYFT